MALVYKKKVTLMALSLMQTLKGHKSVKGMSIQNCLVSYNFGDIQKIKYYPNVLRMWNIDSVDKNGTKKRYLGYNQKYFASFY